MHWRSICVSGKIARPERVPKISTELNWSHSGAPRIAHARVQRRSVTRAEQGRNELSLAEVKRGVRHKDEPDHKAAVH